MGKNFPKTIINNAVLMDYLKLHKTVETNKITITELCKKIHIDRKTFYNNIENKTLKVETLERICEELQVPISTFFENFDFVSEPGVNYKKENKALELDLISLLKELNQCRKEKEAMFIKLSKQ